VIAPTARSDPAPEAGPPGWRLDRKETTEGVDRKDYCPRCKGAQGKEQGA
jgi:hypothetical protein